MNCKPGDLAVIVKCLPTGRSAIGLVVDVLSLLPFGLSHLPNGLAMRADADDWWAVRLPRPSHVPAIGGGSFLSEYAAIPDSWLRPIRDNDGEDETLQWAPVPVKEAA